MKSTNLFVELLVIGFGAIGWILLIILSVFGYEWLLKINLKNISSISSFVPILAVTYVLGIIVDRVADQLALRSTIKINNKNYDKKTRPIPFYEDRRLVLSTDSPIAGLLQYGRSRARICRGWAFNSIIILIFLNVFLFVRLKGISSFWSITICSNALFFCLFIGCCFSWVILKNSEYIKTQEQADYLRGKDNK